MKNVFSILPALLLFSGSSSAQQFSHDISLSGLGNNSARPFGLTYEPSSNRIFAAISGSIFSPNNIVAVIDPSTDQVITTISVGLFPEDIAFTYDLNGEVQYGAVTNSTSGSVTLWDSSLSVVATIPLPDTFGIGTCYPFGITASEDNRYFYITTQDGSGEIYAISTNPISLDTSAGFLQQGRLGGRPLAVNGNLLIPTTTYTPTWTGSESGFSVLSHHNNQKYNLINKKDGNLTYPSGQDIAQLSNNLIAWGGLFSEERIYIFTNEGSLETSIQCSIGAHGIASNENGSLLAICDLYRDSIAIIDINTQQEISAISTQTIGLGYSQPNDALFLNQKLYVTAQGSEEIIVFNNLPTPGLSPFEGNLTISNSTPALGESLEINVEGEGLVALISSESNSPTLTNYGFNMNIGPNLRTHGYDIKTYTQKFRVPITNSLTGKHYWVQGALFSQNSWKTTTPKTLILQ